MHIFVRRKVLVSE